MGVLRLYLALCVVAAHSTPLCPWRIHNGTEAVQLFFMISGFYMAMISGKYASSKDFYFSRCVRIFIPFWIVNAAIFVTSLICGIFADKWLALRYFATWSPEQGGWLGCLLGAISNVTLIGTDCLLFLSDEPNRGIGFTNDFHQLANPLSNYVINIPTWSVAVELMFYLLVPWLNKQKTVTLCAMVGIVTALRVFTYSNLGWNWDPWTYRFMPFELAVFLLGMLSFRLYEQHHFRFAKLKQLAVDKSVRHFVLWIGTALLLAWMLCEITSGVASVMDVNYARLVALIPWLALMPVMFHVTRDNELDRLLGELSYPLYLTHYFIVALVAALYTRQNYIPEYGKGPLVAVVSIVAAIILLRVVIQPLDRYRRTFARPIVL